MMSLKKNISAQILTYLPYILLVLVLVVVLFIRIRLLAVPLERDEGEFAYTGQLLLKCIPPYLYAYTMKLPGVSIMYAFFMFFFGETTVGIHLGLLIVNGICTGLIYLLTKRLFDSNTAIYSCASYAVLSLSTSVNGIFAHATHFIVLFALTGFLLLLCYIDNRRISFLLISGLCFGLSVTMKQHAVLLMGFAILYFVYSTWRRPHNGRKFCIAGSGLLLLGMIIPYVLIVLWMSQTANFNDFCFWTIQYAREYTLTQSLAMGWENFKYNFGYILNFQKPMWLLAGLGCVSLCIKKNDCADRFFVFGLFLFSFLAICPGFFFRSHYFVLFLPVVAILAGAGMSATKCFVSSHTSIKFTQFTLPLLFLAAVAYTLYNDKNNFFTRTPPEVSRALYGANPFPEALEIANYIKRNTSPSDKIAVLGSEPEIYFYADRVSATGYIYMYGLMEIQPYAERMQMQLIREVELARPKYVIVVNSHWSWLQQESSVKSVFYWVEHYVRNQYEMVGIIDILNATTTNYLWDKNTTGYAPLSTHYVKVFKRKSDV